MMYPILDLEATGRQIKKLRMEKQISVMDICEYMGFENPQAVYKWQRGESLPTVDNLYALSRLLGTTIDHILCEKEVRLETVPLCLCFIQMIVPTTQPWGNTSGSSDITKPLSWISALRDAYKKVNCQTS